MFHNRSSHPPFMSYAAAFSAVGLISLGAPAARAQNLLTNGGFESGTFVNNGSNGESLATGSTAILGWTTTNAELAWLENGNPYGLTAQSGNFFLDLTGYHDTSPYGGVTQTVATTVGTTYSLSFYLGTDQSVPVYAGPVSATASAGSTSQNFTFAPSAGLTGDQWQQFTLGFTATAATTAITITGTATVGGQYIGLDSASVSVAAPEPSAIGFLAALSPCALVAGAGHRRRMRARR